MRSFLLAVLLVAVCHANIQDILDEQQTLYVDSKESWDNQYKGEEDVIEDDYDDLVNGLNLGDNVQSKKPMPTNCEQIRKLSKEPLSSGMYQVFDPDHYQSEDHGFRLQIKQVFCEMDGSDVVQV